ncbi:hypothetical protein RRG08_048779 [Elysia crispata]|uniref:Uncharacterized protein n=1 Tax=Elysia crispata TaxID=231223 RepID=A0AAE1AMY5_9GAST|nr:hypothetical protein RRG08_048779 [Elysia crispata]
MVSEYSDVHTSSPSAIDGEKMLSTELGVSQTSGDCTSEGKLTEPEIRALTLTNRQVYYNASFFSPDLRRRPTVIKGK